MQLELNINFDFIIFLYNILYIEILHSLLQLLMIQIGTIFTFILLLLTLSHNAVYK